MVAMGNAVSAVNTAGLLGLAMYTMSLEERMKLLADDDPGGAGLRTFVDVNAPAGGDGSQVSPFNTLDAAIDKINADGVAAGQATATGTPAELAALMRPAHVFLAAGIYTQSKPFTSPAIIIPAPGVTLPAMSWAPPAHNSVSVNVPWAAGVYVEQLDGVDPISLGTLTMVTTAATLGSWGHGITVQGSAWRPGSVANVSTVGAITTTGPVTVAVLIEQATAGAITQDVGQLTARHAEITSVAITTGGATVHDVLIPGTIATSLGIIAEDSDLTGGITGPLEAWSCTIAGAIVGACEFHGCDVQGVTAITGAVPYIGTDEWAQLQATVAVTPTGTVTLFGTTGGVIAAAASPQVILFGVTFPNAPRGVSVTPQAATADASTFVGITAKATTSVTIIHGGAGAGAPTFFHWVATL